MYILRINILNKTYSLSILKNTKTLMTIKNRTKKDLSSYSLKTLKIILLKSNIKINEINKIILIKSPFYDSYMNLKIGPIIIKIFYLLDKITFLKINLFKLINNNIKVNKYYDNFLLLIIIFNKFNKNIYFSLYNKNKKRLMPHFKHFFNFNLIKKKIIILNNVSIKYNLFN